MRTILLHAMGLPELSIEKSADFLSLSFSALSSSGEFVLYSHSQLLPFLNPLFWQALDEDHHL